MRLTQRMPYPEGVAAGQTATAKLPIGRRYHALYLSFAGITLAQMTEIRVIVNAKVIHRYSATDRNAMNLFDGRPNATDDNILVIPFDRYGMKTRSAEENFALNTGVQGPNGLSISSLHVEIDIAEDASAPKIELNAVQSEAIAGGPGHVLHINKYTRDAAGEGDFEISDIPYGKPTSLFMNRVWFNTDQIKEVKIERDLRVIFERKKALNENIQVAGVRNPQTNWFVLDRSEMGYGGDPVALVGFTDYRYKLDMAGKAQMPIYVENIGVLGD